MLTVGVGALVLLSTLMMIRRRSVPGREAPDCAGGGATSIQPAALLNLPLHFTDKQKAKTMEEENIAHLNELKAWGENHNVSLADVTSKTEAIERIRKEIEVLEASLQTDEANVDVQLGYSPSCMEEVDAPVVSFARACEGVIVCVCVCTRAKFKLNRDQSACVRAFEGGMVCVCVRARLRERKRVRVRDSR